MLKSNNRLEKCTRIVCSSHRWLCSFRNPECAISERRADFDSAFRRAAGLWPCLGLIFNAHLDYSWINTNTHPTNEKLICTFICLTSQLRDLGSILHWYRWTNTGFLKASFIGNNSSRSNLSSINSSSSRSSNINIQKVKENQKLRKGEWKSIPSIEYWLGSVA